jgi:hypothetical protein
VNKADTTTTITSDNPDPSVVGQMVTIAYSVAVNSPGAGTPTGNVTVSDGIQSCTAAVAVGQCNITFTTAGSRTLTATYAGDTGFNGSTSAGAAHTVSKANTTTTITSDLPDPSTVGQSVVVKYVVSVQLPGAGTPTGNVTVSDGTVNCTGTVASGQCTLVLVTPGPRSLTATYGGDTNFNGSTSAIEPHTVNYAFTGFFSPVNNAPVSNAANAGQAIPIKWQLTDSSGVGVSNPNSFGYPGLIAPYAGPGTSTPGLTSYQVGCSTGDPTDSVEEYAPGESGLIYQGNGNWQINWKTPKSYAGQCRVLVITLSDGTIHMANFKFK